MYGRAYLKLWLVIDKIQTREVWKYNRTDVWGNLGKGPPGMFLDSHSAMMQWGSVRSTVNRLQSVVAEPEGDCLFWYLRTPHEVFLISREVVIPSLDERFERS